VNRLLSRCKDICTCKRALKQGRRVCFELRAALCDSVSQFVAVCRSLLQFVALFRAHFVICYAYCFYFDPHESQFTYTSTCPT